MRNEGSFNNSNEGIANSQRKFYYRSRPYLINIFHRADRRRHIALIETCSFDTFPCDVRIGNKSPAS